ncbi:hypothetical protein THIOSC15_1610005 [uncultured Thiomicrorhabdus sp.]
MQCTQSVHEQRKTESNKKLAQKGEFQMHPHQLIMTAPSLVLWR